MLFVELCDYFQKIEATSKRLEKTTILAELLHNLSKEEVGVVINLALGQLAAAYERVEFNLAEKMIVRALAQSVNVESEHVTTIFKEIGDLGEVASKLFDSVRQKVGDRNSITVVYEKLYVIAVESGTGSQERKLGGLVRLLLGGTALEAKYIVRMVNESLRLGFSESTMLDVFSYYFNNDKKYSSQLEKIYQMMPDLARIGGLLVTQGIEATLKNAGIVLGVPVIPALAQRLSSVDEMVEKMGEVYVEPKLDGVRVQIHYSADPKSISMRQKKLKSQSDQQSMFEEEQPKIWVKTFTRNLDENTAQFPELLKIREQVKAESVILDAEAVGYDPKTGELLPFQMTITRKRKHGINEKQAQVPLRFFVFDILYKDGQTLIEKPLSERKEILKQVIAQGSILKLNPEIRTSDPEDIRVYHAKQLSEGYEGVLVKKINGSYEPGRVNFNWVKLKEVENSEGKLSDTLDCVVMGYYLGKGKRSGFGIGAFLIGVAGEEGEIVTIAKIGTGLSDETFRELLTKLKPIEVEVMPSEYQVTKNLVPDFWVKGQVVVEVAADEITISPAHTAGYALRFPRLVRLREDKSRNEITTTREIIRMFNMVHKA